MKNLIVLAALLSLFSVTSINAFETSLYGQVDHIGGELVLTSLEDESFGDEVVLTPTAFDAQHNCTEGIFTLVKGLNKDMRFDVVDVVCEELAAY